jgi:1-deoxy-D-xylulose-5-phosphate reductoisomerase
MKIPIFNSIYQKNENKIKSNDLNINILNNLNLQEIENDRFPVIKIINNLTDEDSLFETVIVSANDNLVNRFLKNEIKFTDISKLLLKITNLSEFKKLKKIKPKNVEEITKLAKYVSLKIKTISV